MKIIKIHKPSECIYARIFDYCAPKVEVCSEDLQDFPKNCPLEDWEECPKPPDAVVCTWKEIAKYTPFGESTLKHRFKNEMLMRGVVWRDNLGKRKGKAMYGYVWKIQRFFYLKGQAGEL